MISNARNVMDVYRERVIAQATGNKAVSLDASGGLGTSSSSSFSLTFRDENGVAKKWFKWGRHTFDDDTAIFY